MGMKAVLLRSRRHVGNQPMLCCVACCGCAGRAKYIVGSVQQLLDKPEGGREWLLGLRHKPYAEAHEALCSLPGEGGLRGQRDSTAQHAIVSCQLGRGREWLMGLRDKPYAGAHEALSPLPG